MADTQKRKRLALVGHGKMGRLIEQLAPDHGFDVSLVLDSTSNGAASGITRQNFQSVDAAIEFTHPESAVQNLKALARLRIPTVTGTTGWLHLLADVRAEIDEHRAGLVHSPNFSVGVAVFRRVAATAAAALSSDTYGAWAWEIHHDAKKDAPSGTLLQVVEAMRAGGWTAPIDSASNRAGKHPGTHEIGFDSQADTITLRHTARNRNGFAEGALKAAQWIEGRVGIYTLDDVLFGQKKGENA